MTTNVERAIGGVRRLLALEPPAVDRAPVAAVEALAWEADSGAKALCVSRPFLLAPA